MATKDADFRTHSKFKFQSKIQFRNCQLFLTQVKAKGKAKAETKSMSQRNKARAKPKAKIKVN